jgi:hypothetical protein
VVGASIRRDPVVGTSIRRDLGLAVRIINAVHAEAYG